MPRCFKTWIWLHKYCTLPFSTAHAVVIKCGYQRCYDEKSDFICSHHDRLFCMWHSEKSVFWATASVFEEWPQVLEEEKKNGNAASSSILTFEKFLFCVTNAYCVLEVSRGKCLLSGWHNHRELFLAEYRREGEMSARCLRQPGKSMEMHFHL